MVKLTDEEYAALEAIHGDISREKDVRLEVLDRLLLPLCLVERLAPEDSEDGREFALNDDGRDRLNAERKRRGV